MDEGYIKIYRRFFDHDLWIEGRVFSKAEAWIDILRSARFEDGNKRMLVGNTRVDIKRGEWAISVRFLAERWGWSIHKVHDFLKFLGNSEMVKLGTAEGTKQTILTVCNYDTYNPLLADEGTVEGTVRERCGNSKGTKNKKVIKKEDIICDSNNEAISSSVNTNARETKKTTPTWRTDFEIYKDGLRTAYKALLSDQDFFDTQQRFYPTLDIRLTLEKACTNFWATEAGWKHKKKQRSNDLDWKATLTNALSQPANKVYKNEQRTNKTDNKPSADYKADILRRMGIDPGTGEVF